MPGRYFIKSFGCQMNDYDSDRIGDVLAASHGMSRTEDPSEADVLVMNTCSIREKAEEKVYSLLGEWAQLKRARPEVVIGVGGCVASQEGEALLQRSPVVDLVFGPQTLHRVGALLEERRTGGRAVVDISFPEIEKFDALPPPRAEGPVAFVSVMEGCSKYCTYCVVPYTRGDEVSRPVGSVLAEIRELARQGVREVTLLGQNVNAYAGHDVDGATFDLSTLIHHVAAVDGIGRVRFTTSHPVEFGDSLIEAYAHVPALADHVHLPVQSGSDRVLAAMKRGYTVLEFKDRVRRLRAVRPRIALTTDLIVGFPGETERDFEATMRLVAEAGFDDAFTFLYSARPGTPAASLHDDTPLATKQARLARLQAAVAEQGAARLRRMVGTVQRVLVERPARRPGRDGAAEWAGRTSTNHVVNFAGRPSAIGQFVDLQIVEAMAHSLRGRLIGAAATELDCVS
jgi:tRNA-2-methylthio-N6-dimethylallyladenosine synthase